ncbi:MULTISPECIES: ParA family protein [Methylomonas]|uniref:Chromosome partitioning protein n=2 Tax=Methylomonas TaxID=416 RepID=A0A126T8B3_9GAMM|nr:MULTISPECIES: ParA family protein [Methylomonas]AMK78290.1 chromosome partitioning protein [Methylomonas denitrificans]OAI04007.1 chromosome partitioning protein [Methylomonas methanica]TCV87679.1 chromosome partitioning protein [Methylomonas methanica]
MRARIVAVLNQKGGVGKTTTSVNLTHALAKLGKKITVIDFDPQSHLTVSLGVVDPQKGGIDEVLLEGRNLAKQLIPVRENLNLVIAGPRLQEIEQLVDGGARRGDLLRKALHEGNRDEDFIFIDCPPSSGVLVANALFAADEILVPMTSDYLALQGLSHLMGTIKKFESALKKSYKFSLVMSRYIPTRRMSKDVLSVIQKYFPGQILATTIRETALLAECPSFGKTIFEYRPGCRSARDFTALAKDFLEGRMM